MATGRTGVDWLALERDYLDNSMAIREIARKYGVSDTAIHKRAKASGWVRSGLQEDCKGLRPETSDEAALCVERMKFCGDTDDIIARAVGMDVSTLRNRFGDELANGYARRRRMIVTRMFEAAEALNVSALKKLEEIGRVSAAADAARNRGRIGADQPEERPKPMTKKEARKAAAESLTGKFAVRSAPKLVVDNK